MTSYFDLHTHLLFGVDDGAATADEMFAMLDMAYSDGARAICLTPHFSPYLFGDTYQNSQDAFEILRERAGQLYPDLRLFLGHELGYHDGCLQALSEGRCRTLAGSRYVLVDFPEDVGFFQIRTALERLSNAGYHPILAHAERYCCLEKNLAWLREFRDGGGIIQVNASGVTGAWGRRAKSLWKKLVKGHLVHIVSSDGHNLTSRPPKLSVCMPYLTRWCDAETVRALTWGNAWRVVLDKPLDGLDAENIPEMVPVDTSERISTHGRNEKQRI